MLKVGDKAPDFKLIGNDGKTYSLKNFKGKKIILYFYPKDDTSGCTKEACNFRDDFVNYKKLNIEIVGISADSTESHLKFTNKYNLNFLLLSDPDKSTLNKYGVWQEKSMYGRKYFGIVRTTFLINEKSIITNIFNKVKVDGHSDEILKIFSPN
ncbi:MAG: thioredoxin-dependent thiol peroxidase [Bacteroidetes bacterium]|nr:thioredoxin-dependent thiol peroxidase [Bacteroidota bacterium]